MAKKLKKSTQEQDKNKLLRDRLEDALPADSVVGATPVIPEKLTYALGVLNGEPLGELLESAKTEVSLLRKIKNHTNNLSKQASSTAERDTAIAIYYAAIASALVYHNRKITRFSYESLKQSFSLLIKKSWLSKELKRLFEKALGVCANPSKVKQIRDKPEKV